MDYILSLIDAVHCEWPTEPKKKKKKKRQREYIVVGGWQRHEIPGLKHCGLIQNGTSPGAAQSNQ